MPRNHHSKSNRHSLHPRGILIPMPIQMRPPIYVPSLVTRVPIIQPVSVTTMPIIKPRNIIQLNTGINLSTNYNIGILYHNNQNILIVKNSNNEWSIPYDNKNSNETDIESYIRIFKDKTSINLNGYNPNRYQIRHSDGSNSIIFIIRSDTTVNENDNLKLISYDNLKKINNGETINNVSKLNNLTKSIINKIVIN